jgi:hypothetical protein
MAFFRRSAFRPVFQNNMNIQQEQNAAPSTGEAWEQVVRQRVGRLRFGVVQLVVHEGRVTQVETTEKVRLPAIDTPAR